MRFFNNLKEAEQLCGVDIGHWTVTIGPLSRVHFGVQRLWPIRVGAELLSTGGFAISLGMWVVMIGNKL